MQESSDNKINPTVMTILRKNKSRVVKSESLNSENLGHRVKQLRLDQGLTQTELAKRGGVSHSALSKIETNQLSPTFSTLLRIAEGLKIDVSELLSSTEKDLHRTRRVVTRHGQGEFHESENYVYETLCDELANKRMIPIVARIKANSLEQFGPLIRHSGEEVIYVLEGEIELHTEHYSTATLKKGDCAYFDSPIGHACISAADEEALVFWVSTPG